VSRRAGFGFAGRGGFDATGCTVCTSGSNPQIAFVANCAFQRETGERVPVIAAAFPHGRRCSPERVLAPTDVPSIYGLLSWLFGLWSRFANDASMRRGD